jgi:hypothetical protein
MSRPSGQGQMLSACFVVKLWERLPAAINANVRENLSRLEAAPTEKATIKISSYVNSTGLTPPPLKGEEIILKPI